MKLKSSKFPALQNLAQLQDKFNKLNFFPSM